MTLVDKKQDMSKLELMTGGEAVARAIQLARPEVIAAYPITPQTPIVETLSKMVSNGELNAEYIAVESEHSAMGACIGASLAGSRTATATSSHGLLYLYELVWWAGMTRVPVYMACVNRALNPWNIWVDHQDSMACRDAGWIQLYAKNNQEVLDLTICAFKIGEHRKLSMPVMVCLDGFILSHTSAQVEVPAQEQVDAFLPPYDPLFTLDPENPRSHGSLMYPEHTEELRLSLSAGFDSARVLIPRIFEEYQTMFGRLDKGMIEVTGDLANAEVGIMALGTMGEEAEKSLEILAEKGIKAVVLRPRVFRPFPKKELITLLQQLSKVLVIDRAVSFGNAGQMAIEVQAELFANKLDIDFHQRVMGLGGVNVTYVDIANEVEQIME